MSVCEWMQGCMLRSRICAGHCCAPKVLSGQPLVEQTIISCLGLSFLTGRRHLCHLDNCWFIQIYPTSLAIANGYTDVVPTTLLHGAYVDCTDKHCHPEMLARDNGRGSTMDVPVVGEQQY